MAAEWQQLLKGVALDDDPDKNNKLKGDLIAYFIKKDVHGDERVMILTGSPQDVKRRILSLLGTTVKLMSIQERLAQPLPEPQYVALKSTQTTRHYPPPTQICEEWVGVEELIQADLAGWLAAQSQEETHLPPDQPSMKAHSEPGISAWFYTQMCVVQRALRQAGLDAEWALNPLKGSTDKGAAPQPPGPLKKRRTADRLMVEGEGLKKPDFELLLGKMCKTFVEMKVPILLAAAGINSLAALLSDSPSKPGRPLKDAERMVPQRVLSSILGQAEAYCRERRVRYFAISTYTVTWVGCISNGRMLISRGFQWSDVQPTVLQLLVWLTLKALGPDGALASGELPPRGPAPGTSGSNGVNGGTNEDGSSGSNPNSGSTAISAGRAAMAGAVDGDTAQSSTGSSCDEDGEEVVQWHAVPASPGGGVLGSGITGDVLAGWLGSTPVAVKYGTVGSRAEAALAHEASVYEALAAIQGTCIPRLLDSGPVSGGRYVLVMSRVFGRQLRGDGHDAHLRPQALAALRAVHAAGYLHGDVRLPNFMVVDGEEMGGQEEEGKEGGGHEGAGTPAHDAHEARAEDGAPMALMGPQVDSGSTPRAARVVLLDFGHASQSSSRSEQLQEEMELCELLAGPEGTLFAAGSSPTASTMPTPAAPRPATGANAAGAQPPITRRVQAQSCSGMDLAVAGQRVGWLQPGVRPMARPTPLPRHLVNGAGPRPLAWGAGLVARI